MKTLNKAKKKKKKNEQKIRTQINVTMPWPLFALYTHSDDRSWYPCSIFSYMFFCFLYYSTSNFSPLFLLLLFLLFSDACMCEWIQWYLCVQYVLSMFKTWKRKCFPQMVKKKTNRNRCIAFNHSVRKYTYVHMYGCVHTQHTTHTHIV